MKILSKHLSPALFILVAGATLRADYSVGIEGAGETKTSYASATVALSGLDWNLTDVLIGTSASDWKNGARSARLRGYGTSAMSMLADKADGLGTLTFKYRRYGTAAQVDWRVDCSTNSGASWVQVGATFTAPANDTVQTFSAAVYATGGVRIRIRRATETGTSDRQLNIDDIVLTDYTVAANRPPTLSVDPASASVFPGTPVVATLSASDPDGDSLSLSATSLDIGGVGAFFDPESGTFSWTPTAAGTYGVLFSADDARGGVASNLFTITVLRAASGGFAWNFDALLPAALPTTLGIQCSEISRGNNNGSSAFLSNTSPSTGYSGASGGTNGSARARSGTLNTAVDGSAYFEFALTPAQGIQACLTGISFGSRSTLTGPQAIALYTGVNGYTTPVTDVLIAVTNSNWALHSADASVTFRRPTVFRIFGYNSTATTSTDNWRIDDLRVYVTTEMVEPTLIRIR